MMMFASTSSRSSTARASFRRATTTAKKCVRGQGHGVTSIGNRRLASNGRTRRVAVEAGTFFKTKADIEADIEANAEVEAEPEVKAEVEVEAEVEAQVVTSEEALEADAAPEEEDVEEDSFGAKKLPCGALLFTFDA
jgi:hypothetical protein|tara:strand:+ start:169 stop:579 length:411 start_codon:yes stop_codon:yes gene_type:complete|mmetsp:Transcript_8848/g.25761  ORF Transcript_8848/g.25761 Transcript_8848/m.25761 type:complete len:137 (+) Transcript_8848:165-575(+)